MSSLVTVQQQSSSNSVADDHETSTIILQSAIKILANDSRLHAYRKAIRIESDGDRLIMSGRLPTFYLKQVLQETLRQIDGVHRIVNHVDVD
jgi:hypothetical protein